jgi:hypothetical protein
VGLKIRAISFGRRWRDCRSAEEYRMPEASGEHLTYWQAPTCG